MWLRRRLGHLIWDIQGTNGADAHRDIVEATIFFLLRVWACCSQEIREKETTKNQARFFGWKVALDNILFDVELRYDIYIYMYM